MTGKFTVRRLNQLTESVERVARDSLAAMRGQGTSADLVPSFAAPVPVTMICTLLGVPYEDRDRFMVDVHESLSLVSMELMIAATERIGTYLRGLIRQKRATPSEDILSDLVNSPEQLTDDELEGMAILLLQAGVDTTTNMIGLGTYTLLTHPDQLAALKSDPSLLDNAVEELMRYLTIVHTGSFRAALEDIDAAGVRINAGDMVIISLAAANRDSSAFDQADTFDITRSTAGHIGFGHGLHACLGQQLARIEMRAAFSLLFEEFPGLRLAVPADEIPMRDDMQVYGVHSLPVTWS
jgi:cytochrome P450